MQLLLAMLSKILHNHGCKLSEGSVSTIVNRENILLKITSISVEQILRDRSSDYQYYDTLK